MKNLMKLALAVAMMGSFGLARAEVDDDYDATLATTADVAREDVAQAEASDETQGSASGEPQREQGSAVSTDWWTGGGQ